MPSSEGDPERPKMAVSDLLKKRYTPYSALSASYNIPQASTTSRPVYSNPQTHNSPFTSMMARFKLSKDAPDSYPSVSAMPSEASDSRSSSPSTDSVASASTRQLRERKSRPVFNFDDEEEEEEGEEGEESPKDNNEESDDDEENETVIRKKNVKRRRRKPVFESDDDDDDEDAEYVDEEEKEDRQHEAVAMSDKIVMLRNVFPSVAVHVLQQALDQAAGSVVTASKMVARDLVISGKGFKLPSALANIPPLQTPMAMAQRDSPPRKRLRRKASFSSGSESDSDGAKEEVSPRVSLEEARKMAQTVRFYNNATSQEIQDVTGCKPEHAEALITQLRPFVDVADLREKLRRKRGLSEKYISAYVDMMDGYSAVDQIIGDVERLGEELRQVIEVWQGSKLAETADSPASEDAPDEAAGTHLAEVNITNTQVDKSSRFYKEAMDGFLTEQPDYVNKEMTLKNYQLLGVNWMLLLYRKGISGILADEMGLGKTAQVISFLGRLLELGEMGPHLIIVPASTLANWLREFERFCPKLMVRAYHGTQQERLDLRYELAEEGDFQVLVTTYNIATGAKEDRSFLRKLKCKSMILDEGHMIKNCASARYTHLMSLRTPFRLLLTGTPLQNNLQELVSLLMFIMPDMFLENEEEIRKIFKIKVFTSTKKSDKDDKHTARHQGGSNVAQMLSRQRIARAKKMMTPFVLRRRKADVLKDLPQKVQRIERCVMTASQQTLYDKILHESKESFEKAMDAKAGGNKRKGTESQFEKLSNIVIHLRKAADHPLLFRNLYTDNKLKRMAKAIMKEEKYWDANVDYIYEDMTVMSDFELRRLCEDHRSIQSFTLKDEEWMDAGKVQWLKTVLPEMKQEGNKVLVFSQFTRMLDILELVMHTLGVRFLRLDGETPVAERQGLIDEFNDDPAIDVFLLSTKAGGFGINLTAANVVVLYDLDFNPQNDRQAEDRAHRVGQTRDVTVIKLIANGSIEEHILKMADIKLRLDRSVSSHGELEGDEDEAQQTQQKESVHSLLKSALLSS